MRGVVGTDEEVGAGAREAFAGFGQNFADGRKIVRLPQRHGRTHGDDVERDIGMVVLAETRLALVARGEETERRPFGAVREYSDAFHCYG